MPPPPLPRLDPLPCLLRRTLLPPRPLPRPRLSEQCSLPEQDPLPPPLQTILLPRQMSLSASVYLSSSSSSKGSNDGGSLKGGAECSTIQATTAGALEGPAC